MQTRLAAALLATTAAFGVAACGESPKTVTPAQAARAHCIQWANQVASTPSFASAHATIERTCEEEAEACRNLPGAHMEWPPNGRQTCVEENSR